MPDDERGDEGEEAERKQKHHVYACFEVVDHFICLLPSFVHSTEPQKKKNKRKNKEIPRKMIKGLFFFECCCPLKATNKEL
jgi:hypothetical protein